MMALVPGLGNSNLNSITAMREKVQILRSLPYDSLAFGSTKYWIVSADEKINMAPTSFSLEQNYPNPFNPSTKISWQVASKQLANIKSYDVLGNEVATLLMNTNQQEVMKLSSMPHPVSGIWHPESIFIS